MNSDNQKNITKFVGMALTAASIIAILWTFRYILAKDIWFDELFTVKLASMNFTDLYAFAARDVHPPLYYCIVRIIYVCGKTISQAFDITMAAKLSALMPYIFVLIYAMTYVRKNYGWLCCGLTTAFIEFMPQMSAYMVEARMYSWGLFAVFAMFIHAMEAIKGVPYTYDSAEDISYEDACTHIFSCFFKKGKKIAGAGRMYVNLLVALLYGIMAMYLHYYAFIAAICIVIGIFIYTVCNYYRDVKLIRGIEKQRQEGVYSSRKVYIRPSIASLLAAIAIALVAYVPWEGALLSQVGAVSGSYWIQPLTIRSLAGCIKFIYLPAFTKAWINYLTAFVLIVTSAICIIWYIRKVSLHNTAESSLQLSWKKAYILIALATLAGTIAVGFIASILIRPVFVYRYMIPALGVFWLGISIAFSSAVECIIESKEDKALSIKFSIIKYFVPVVFLFIVVAVWIRDFNLFRWEENKKIAGMNDTALAIELIENNFSDKTVVYNFNQVQALMWNYIDNDSILWGETNETLIADICGTSPIIMTDDVDELIALTGGDFLFIGTGNVREEIIGDWADSGLKAELICDSCLLERYYFNVYNITQ